MSEIPGVEYLWSIIKEHSPEEVSIRTGVETFEKGYAVVCMGRRYEINVDNKSISGPEGPIPDLLLLSYLARAKNVPPSDEWITPGEVPGGDVFFQGPHALPTAGLAKRFGDDSEGFRNASKLIGGVPLEFGDASSSFLVLPRIRIGLVLWMRDEEFPPEVKVMFDRTIAIHLPLDVILALVGFVGSVFLAATEE